MTLTVDDDLMNVEVINQLLEAYGVHSESALSGQRAIDMVKRRIELVQEDKATRYQVFKLILLDYSMPEMNGPEVAVEIRRIVGEAGLDQPYICCCTAYGDESYRQEALASGMNDFITKPMDIAVLENMIKILND